MADASCNNTSEISFEIAQINSFYKFNNVSTSPVMKIGKISSEYIYRVFIKFHLNQLPSDIRIIEAELSFIVINTLPKYIEHTLDAYTLNSDWDTSTINWCNQPIINFNNKLFEKSVYKNNKYRLNITEQVVKWYNSPNINYGMVLTGDENHEYSKVEICTKDGSICDLSLKIKYVINQDIHVIVEQTQFIEYDEKVIAKAGEYFTKLRDISVTKTVAYLVKNNGEVPINVVVEYSPDGNSFRKEDRVIPVKARAMEIVSPICFSKYIRLSIIKSDDGNQAVIDTWLQLQI